MSSSGANPAVLSDGQRTALLVLSALWIGILVALSFIETPMKFTVPGMDLTAALGLGQKTFTVLNVTGVVMTVLLTVTVMIAPSPRRFRIYVGGLWLVLIAEVAVIRPLLSARTDRILRGESVPPSSLHVVYVAADVIILALLVALLVAAAAHAKTADRSL